MKSQRVFSNEEIRSYVEGAFVPHDCRTEIWDYDSKLKFKIFNSSGVVLATVENVSLNSINTLENIDALLEVVKTRMDVTIKALELGKPAK